jgi:hypothetical protein
VLDAVVAALHFAARSQPDHGTCLGVKANISTALQAFEIAKEKHIAAVTVESLHARLFVAFRDDVTWSLKQLASQ